MPNTSIEWCDHSINPIRAHRADGKNVTSGHVCSKISPGCKNCYASALQKRFRMPSFNAVEQQLMPVKPYLYVPALEEVLARKKPTRYFWCDMTDMFLSIYPPKWLIQIFATMAATPQHTHLVLTKRPGAAHFFFSLVQQIVPRAGSNPYLIDWPHPLGTGEPITAEWPLPNLHLGVSVESQEWANNRIPKLFDIPAAVRWISAEPLLGPISFDSTHESDPIDSNFLSGIGGQRVYDGRKCALDWVVVGGESGNGARPCDVAWIEDIVKQCQRAHVPVFVKQLGKWPRVGEVGEIYLPLSDRKGGNMEEWPENLRVRQLPNPFRQENVQLVTWNDTRERELL